MPLSIQHQADSAGDKAVSLIVDNSGSNAAAAFKGVNKATQNGDTVADLVVSLDGETVTLAAQKNEDAAHSSGDAGLMALAVRKDTATALAGTDGDYAPLEVDAVGALHTRDRAGYADNDTFTRGSSRLIAGLAGIYESTVSALTAGKVALARLTSRGAVVTAGDQVSLYSGTISGITATDSTMVGTLTVPVGTKTLIVAVEIMSSSVPDGSTLTIGLYSIDPANAHVWKTANITTASGLTHTAHLPICVSAPIVQLLQSSHVSATAGTALAALPGQFKMIAYLTGAGGSTSWDLDIRIWGVM